MINKEEFTEYILNYQAFEQAISRMEEAFSGKKYGCNLFDCDWVDSVGKMLDIFMESHFTETGSDWVFYYLFEDEKEEHYEFNSLEELYDVMLKFKNDYFLNV